MTPSDPTAGLVFSTGHYIVHFAFFIAIYFVQKPPAIIKCLLKNELSVD